MSNLALSPAYAEPLVALTPAAPVKVKKKSRVSDLTAEDAQIVDALHLVKSDLDHLHNRYDETTDTLLLESVIYELKAANLKYRYYINLCKQRGIVCRTTREG